MGRYFSLTQMLSNQMDHESTFSPTRQIFQSIGLQKNVPTGFQRFRAQSSDQTGEQQGAETSNFGLSAGTEDSGQNLSAFPVLNDSLGTTDPWYEVSAGALPLMPR